MEDIDLENIEEVNDNIGEETVQSDDPQVPDMYDEGWTEYVLSQLRESEKVDGAPKVEGLRRLVEKYVGRIIESTSRIAGCFSDSAGGIVSSVEHELVIISGRKHDYSDIKYTGCADAGKHNTDHPYSRYPTAVAETRAEARALRKALRLNVIAAEEVDGLTERADSSPSQGLNQRQIEMLNMMCKRINIDTREFINDTLGKEYNNIVGVYASDFHTLMETINKYQGDKNLIPVKLQNCKFTHNFEQFYFSVFFKGKKV